MRGQIIHGLAATLLITLTILLISCAGTLDDDMKYTAATTHPVPYPAGTSYEFNNPILKTNLTYMSNLQDESNWFQKMGENKYGDFLAVFLTIEGFLAATAAIVAGTSIWGKKSNTKAIITFVIAIVIACSSACTFYIREENDRFYREYRHQYIALSHEINAVIKDFYIGFQSGGYNDDNIESRKSEFLKLATDSFSRIDSIKTDYFNKYRLEINPMLNKNSG